MEFIINLRPKDVDDAADLEYFQTLQKLVPRMTQLVAKMKRQSEE